MGDRGADLLVTTEQLSLHVPDKHNTNFQASLNLLNEADEDDEDWTRPTLRARFSPLDMENTKP